MFNTDKRNEALDNLRKACYEYNEERELIMYHTEELFKEKEESRDLLKEIEKFINNLANTPKTLIDELAAIKNEYQTFDKEVQKFEIEAKKIDIGNNISAAAAAAGVGVATMGPTAAIAIATTFGTASTGTAIASLSGAAATNAALAWLGGGALAAGGGGMAAGNALLAMAGPVGWFIAGGAFVTSAVILNSKNKDIAEQAWKQADEINSALIEITKNSAEIKQLRRKIRDLYYRLKDELADFLAKNIRDYCLLSEDDKLRLGAFVNFAKSLAGLLNKKVG